MLQKTILEQLYLKHCRAIGFFSICPVLHRSAAAWLCIGVYSIKIVFCDTAASGLYVEQCFAFVVADTLEQQKLLPVPFCSIRVLIL